MARKYFVEDYYTERIEDFNPTTWLTYGGDKMGLNGCDIKLVGVRNWRIKQWTKPQTFTHGKGCKHYTQTAMKHGFVELRFSYTPFDESAYRI